MKPEAGRESRRLDRGPSTDKTRFSYGRHSHAFAARGPPRWSWRGCFAGAPLGGGRFPGAMPIFSRGPWLVAVDHSPGLLYKEKPAKRSAQSRGHTVMSRDLYPCAFLGPGRCISSGDPPAEDRSAVLQRVRYKHPSLRGTSSGRRTGLFAGHRPGFVKQLLVPTPGPTSVGRQRAVSRENGPGFGDQATPAQRPKQLRRTFRGEVPERPFVGLELGT